MKKLTHLYDVHYKKLMVFSFVLLFACIGLLIFNYASTGELFQKGVSLKGGITITAKVSEHVDLESALSERFPSADISVRDVSDHGVVSAVIIEASDIDADALTAVLPELGVPLNEGEFSVESMGSSLGDRFFSQTMKAVLFAFIMMAVVVYFTFRSVIPSSFVILAAASNIVSTLAVLNLLDVKLSTAGIAALLMLIGYSVDTDILLTTKVLKRRKEGGTVFQRTLGAMKTGLTMSFCALASSIVGMIFIESDAVRQIMLIVTIGMAFDLIYTWFQNAGILRLYMEKKHGN